jgi:hypothetical protein
LTINANSGFLPAALLMTSFVKLTICSSQHGATMRQMGWRSGSDAGGNVEAQF